MTGEINKTVASEYSREHLENLYLAALHDFDIANLNGYPTGKTGESKNISNIFLPSIPENIHLAKHKIMLIGSEYPGWNVKSPSGQFVSMTEYIQLSMEKHRKFFSKTIAKKNSKGGTFHSFTDDVVSKCGPEGIIYSNLFCSDWKSGNPIKSPPFKQIMMYSKRLLDVQISFFKPDIIIFANGITSYKQRHELFPIQGVGQVCRNGKDYSDRNIPKGQLWEFELYESIRCFRIHHPSGRRTKGAAIARKFLIELLPSAN
jgi:hypothetical protein